MMLCVTITLQHSTCIFPRFRHVEVLEDVVRQRGHEPLPGLRLRHLGAILRIRVRWVWGLVPTAFAELSREALERYILKSLALALGLQDAG